MCNRSGFKSASRTSHINLIDIVIATKEQLQVTFLVKRFAKVLSDPWVLGLSLHDVVRRCLAEHPLRVSDDERMLEDGIGC